MLALLATGRVANLPTVCSNVFAGFCLSSLVLSDSDIGVFTHTAPIAPLLLLMLSCCLIYVAGCMLGDALDHSFDLKNRPTRPIPLGILDAHRVRVTSYLIFIVALIILSLISPLAISLTSANHLTEDGAKSIQTHEIILGCLLTMVVAGYAFYHKKNKAAAFIMMGSCRFLLVILAMSFAHKSGSEASPTPDQWLAPHLAWFGTLIIVPAIGVGTYTILLSWVASTESKPGVFQSRNILAVMLLAVPLASVAVVFQMPSSITLSYLSYSIAMTLCYLWMLSGLHALKKSKPIFVSKALAGFCLLDATFLAPFEPVAAAVCGLLFLFALSLQKIAPAT